MTRWNRLPVLLAASALLTASATGCSDQESGEDGKYRSAASVCDGAMDQGGAASLKEVTGTDRFEESPVEGARSFDKLADTLREDPGSEEKARTHRLCYVKEFAMAIDVAWGPGPLLKALPSDGEVMRFKEFDALTFDTSANTAFPCTVAGRTSRNPLQMRVHLVPEADSASAGNHRAEARILRSAAVKLASEMGCREESRLPGDLARLTLVPAGNCGSRGPTYRDERGCAPARERN
ncbi:hypothetical protein [Streptomyces cucumeris]|uniref:hypothetical protein n=1 Tax=Streptomyces cucumeris TaxID=2962890 RepID=UPI003D725D23